MAYEENVRRITLPASGDLSDYQYRFVNVNSSGQVALASDGGFALGVLGNDPAAAGRAAAVEYGGSVKVRCGGTITAGGYVSSDANGKAVAWTSGDQVNGVALESGADGEIITIHQINLGTV